MLLPARGHSIGNWGSLMGRSGRIFGILSSTKELSWDSPCLLFGVWVRRGFAVLQLRPPRLGGFPLWPNKSIFALLTAAPAFSRRAPGMALPGLCRFGMPPDHLLGAEGAALGALCPTTATSGNQSHISTRFLPRGAFPCSSIPSQVLWGVNGVAGQGCRG